MSQEMELLTEINFFLVIKDVLLTSVKNSLHIYILQITVVLIDIFYFIHIFYSNSIFFNISCW